VIAGWQSRGRDLWSRALRLFDERLLKDNPRQEIPAGDDTLPDDAKTSSGDNGTEEQRVYF